MCAPRYIVVTGDAPEESVNKFLEDYLPDGWGVSWSVRGTKRLALHSADGEHYLVGGCDCIAYDVVYDMFKVERLKLLIDLLLDENMAHFSPMKGLHQFRMALDLSKLESREKL